MTILRRGLSLAVLLCLSPAFAVPPSGLDARITVEVRHAPLSRFLDAVSAQAKVNFVLADGLENQKVTAFLHDVTVTEALEVVRQLKGVEFRRLGGGTTFLVAPKGMSKLDSPPLVGAGPDLDKHVTVNVRGVTLSQFLDAVSRQTHANFALDESVADKRITAFLQDVPAREAVEIVMAEKGLTCRRLAGREAYTVEGQDAALRDKLDKLSPGDRVLMGREIRP